MQEKNKMVSYIYKFENKINGKIYIGKTKNIKEKIYQHSHVTKNKKPNLVMLLENMELIHLTLVF